MRNKLIAYALDFVSFLLENDIKLDKAILFGSVVTEEFDRESDIDVFLETKEKEEKVNKLLNQYIGTKGEIWRLKGINNSISLKIGMLEKWPDLRRSIQSSGLLLYGKFKEMPGKIDNYSLFLLNFNKLKRAKKVSLWRKIYGYSQKIKNKTYKQEGIVYNLKGRKLERGVIAIPSENSKQFRDFLNKNKIKFKIIEIWSDLL